MENNIERQMERMEQRMESLETQVARMGRLVLRLFDENSAQAELGDMWGEIVNHEDRFDRLEAQLGAVAEGGSVARESTRIATENNTDLIAVIAYLIADLYDRSDLTEEALSATIRASQGDTAPAGDSMVGRLLASMNAGGA